MFLTRFWKDTAGNVAMIFGLATLPAMTSAGAALDILTAYNYQAQMQAAADAAALASAANEHKNSRERERIAHEAFRVNMEAAFPGRAPPQGSLTVRDGVHRYTASAEQPTSLMKLVGIRTIDTATTLSTGGGGNVTSMLTVIVVLTRSPSILPSAESASSAWVWWSRPCASDRKLSLRSPVHFTGRPTRRAAQTQTVSSA